MDIEKLTKSQIVLLTLLVSFVTSIATGIVTVSLMQQAPPAIAETVNRVIENTIETVATSSKSQTASAATTQKTVIVNEADQIAQAVKQISPSIVRIYSLDDQPQFEGLGVVTNASGTIAADIHSLGDQASAIVQTQDGAKIRAFVISRDPSSGLLYLSPATTSSPAMTWTPAQKAANAPVLGQLVIAIEGISTVRISQGLVTEIMPADSSTQFPEAIVTDIDSSAIQPGSVIIDSTANIVGVSTGVSRTSSPSGFVPASLISTQK
ncbi:MAG: S1C family serine protease [Candidatus Pacebacteria bacterium]|nr:S1C family serine protease [Candidatus Paceibacterota bacterium]